MEKFDIEIRWSVHSGDLRTAKTSAEYGILSLIAGTGAKNLHVIVRDERGIEHKVASSTEGGDLQWVHDEPAGPGSHGLMVRTIRED